MSIDRQVFTRVTFPASGDYQPIFPNDPPGIFREVFCNNQSGIVLRFRSTDDTANTSAVFENSSSGSFFFGALETIKLEGRHLSTSTSSASVTFAGGMPRRLDI